MTGRDMAGTLITETFDYDNGRQVTVYYPPSPPTAVVFAGDGQRISKWGTLLESASSASSSHAHAHALPPTMIVGVHGLTDEMSRLHEYSPVFDAERFAAHEKFFVHDVRQWVQSRFFPGVALVPQCTAVFGASAAGELALALGVRHPDVYGSVLCASPGAGYKPPDTMPTQTQLLPRRAYLVAGDQEPFFLDNAKRWADALRNAGVEVVMEKRQGGHGGDFWKEEFPRMVSWAFLPVV